MEVARSDDCDSRVPPGETRGAADSAEKAHVGSLGVSSGVSEFRSYFILKHNLLHLVYSAI